MLFHETDEYAIKSLLHTSINFHGFKCKGANADLSDA